MAKIFLIPCVKEKLDTASPAEKLYTSDFFRRNLSYARSNHADHIFILSGKYGLLHLDDVIEPYDVNLHDASLEEQLKWAEQVTRQLGAVANLQHDEFVIMADAIYRRFLLPILKHVHIIDLS